MTLHSTGILGTVIGPLGTRQLGAVGVSAYSVTQVKYDVAIGGVPFMIKPTPDTPYQRSTAQFRKNQFDAEASVGEQSLDGFWRRSQLSFHQGAGIKYFDAFTDDVSARAWKMDGVDPWTPGQVTLGPSFSTGLTAAHSKALTGYDGTTTPVVWFRKTSDSNKLHKWDGATDSAVSAAAVTAFAPDPNVSGRCFYDSGVNLKTSNGATTIAHLSAGTWANLWWAKQRLIGLDNLGNFYAVAANPPSDVAITQGSTGTGYFWSGNARTDSWVLADSPAAIFLAYGRTVYKVVLDDTGAVPVLAGGVVAAELPTDETVLAMKYYLGFLVIVTNLGARVATVSPTGDVVYGPRLFDLSTSKCRVLAASGSRVWFTGQREEDANPRLFVIDLSQPTGTDGTYGWAVEADVPLSASATDTGVQVFGAGILPWDGFTFFSAGTAASRTGYLQTGYIRFGTMEPKAFDSVRIKLDGAGSVAVSLVRRGETETLLTNVAASANVDLNVPLNLPAPEEFIGLKFTLTADSSTGESPILLGYQLKALPAPKRNRLIQYPLMLYPGELTAGGVTTTADVFERMQALEAMEEEGGIVVVQDLRPGVNEQFSAFVEEIQFIGSSPPVQGISNFAGTALVTVRKV